MMDFNVFFKEVTKSIYFLLACIALALTLAFAVLIGVIYLIAYIRDRRSHRVAPRAPLQLQPISQSTSPQPSHTTSESGNIRNSHLNGYGQSQPQP